MYEILLLSGVSGVGKTSIANWVVKSSRDIVEAVSHTTRAPREGEVDGEDYYFISEEDFAEMSMAGQFLETTEYRGNHYGYTYDTFTRPMDEGKQIVCVVDTEGVRQIRENFGDDIVCAIRVMCPGGAIELRKRLLERHGGDVEKVDARLNSLEGEQDELNSIRYQGVVLNRYGFAHTATSDVLAFFNRKVV